jgi:hypothetical protein
MTNLLVYVMLVLVTMKKTIIALLAFGVCLWAADFWQAKPYTDWTDKDVQKMLTNSPWARSVSIPMSGPATGGVIGSAAGNSGADPVSQPISEGGGGRGGRGGGNGAGPAATPGIGGDASVAVVYRWQNAKPVKEALVKLKYGAEAATSAEAKALLEREEASYVIVVAGALRPLLRGDAESIRKAAAEQSSLSAKGKSTLKPSDVQVGATNKGVEMYFYFPRSTPFAVEDKEAEFATKLGGVDLKTKFRFKDMVVSGKLEL